MKKAKRKTMPAKKTTKSRSSSSKSAKSTKLYSNFKFNRKVNFIFFIAAFVVIGSVIVFSYAAPNNNNPKRPKGDILASVSGAGAMAVERKGGKTVVIKQPASAELASNGSLYCTQENSNITTTQTVSSDKIDFVKTVANQGLTDAGIVQNANGPVVVANNVVVDKDGQKVKKSYVTVSAGSEKAIADELKSLCASGSGTTVPIEQVPMFNDDEAKPSASLFDKLQSYVFKPVSAVAVTQDPNAANFIYNSMNGVRTSIYWREAPLTRVACLDSAAYAWSNWMANHNALWHSSSVYGSNLIYPNYCGSGWSAMAENIGVGPKSNVAAIYDAFVKSTPHFNNIVNSTYTKTGVGAWDDAAGQVWITQGFWKDAGK